MVTDIEVAIAAAAAGAAEVVSAFGASLRRFDKGDGDFATEADIASEQAIIAVLRRERAGDSVLAEESGASGSTNSARTWLIDPLCGTLNFAAQMRVVAVNVALKVADKFTASAVADPFSKEIFWSNGSGAFVRLDGKDSPLIPNGNSNIVDVSYDPPDDNDDGVNPLRLLLNPKFRRLFRTRIVSSSIALAWVATGQRAAYVTNGEMHNNVHFGAGLALCEAAGCKLTDLHGDRWENGNGLIAAADAPTHEAILRLLR